MLNEFVIARKHFYSLGRNFCFRNNVVRSIGKQINIDRKHNVSATMFPVETNMETLI